MNLKKLLGVFFLMVIFSPSALAVPYSEKRIDEIIDSLNEVPKAIRDDFEILMELDSASQALCYDRGLVYANIGLAYHYRDLNTEMVAHYIAVSDKVLVENPAAFTTTNLVEHYLIKGFNCGEQGNTLRELHYYLKADTLAGNDPTGELQIDVKFLLLNYYNRKKEYEKALTCNLELIAYHAAHQNDAGGVHSYAMSLQNAGLLHLALHHNDSAVYYANRSLDAGLGSFSEGPWGAYVLLGKAYLGLGELDEAENYVRLLSENEVAPFSEISVKTALLSADLFYERENYTEAAKKYQIAAVESDSIGWLSGITSARAGLIRAELYGLNRPDLVAHFNLIDSIRHVSNKKQSEAIERQLIVQYETSEKELEIQRLQLQNQEKRALIIQVIVGAVLVVFVSVMLVYRNRTRRKLLATEVERQRLAALVVKTELNEAAKRIQAKTAMIDRLERDVENKEAVLANEMMALLDQKYIDEADWAAIIMHFDSVHDNFTKKMHAEHPNLKPGDIRLLLLINLGYSNKGISAVNNITEDGVKKAKRRLLNKMQLIDFPRVT